ncbi:MAG: hypothetical protein ACFFED_06735 [Candidatus Thorarchaeota archaeon]
MSKSPDEIIDRAEELCVLCEEEEAERMVREALERKPQHLGLQTELAIILSRQGYDTKAETILRKVIKQDPYHERAVASLGRLLDNSLRCDEAETLFTIFLKKRPNAHIVFDDLCRLWFDNDEEEKALLSARKHIQEYPTDIHAYDALRYVLARLEDDLGSDLADDPTSQERLLEYSKNIIEQYSVLKKLKMMSGTSEESERYKDDLEEDLARITGELKDLQNRYVTLKVPLSKEMAAVFQEALADL